MKTYTVNTQKALFPLPLLAVVTAALFEIASWVFNPIGHSTIYFTTFGSGTDYCRSFQQFTYFHHVFKWLREEGSNLRFPGYEPDEITASLPRKNWRLRWGSNPPETARQAVGFSRNLRRQNGATPRCCPWLSEFSVPRVDCDH